MLPTRVDAAARERIEGRVQAIGRDLLEKSLAAQPTVLSPDYWAEQAGEWVLADDELKVRLFRLVDCMPMLDDPAALDRHLREYVDDDVIERLPQSLRMALRASRSVLLAPLAAPRKPQRNTYALQVGSRGGSAVRCGPAGNGTRSYKSRTAHPVHERDPRMPLTRRITATI